MLRYFLIALGIYFLYRFIFDLVIPVFRTTRRIKKQFREMNEAFGRRGAASAPPSEPARPTKAVSGDYIEFEEVK